MSRRDLTLFLVLAIVGLLIAWAGVYGIPSVTVDGGGGEEPRADAPSGGTSAAPRRIAVAVPSVCEIVFHLGCGDRVVAVSDFCTHPPEALTKEKIGGWLNPNRERIIALQPDLVLTQGAHEAVARICAEQDIGFRAFHIESLDDIRNAMLAVGETLGVPERAAEKARAWDAALDRIRQRVAGRPRPGVFLTLSRPAGKLGGLMIPGPDTFLAELVEIAGGKNIFADADGDWPTVSKETLAVRDPDVILELRPEGADAETREKLHADWTDLPSLPAVKNDRIRYLTGDHLLVPGPRVLQTVEDMARAIHPEAFDD